MSCDDSFASTISDVSSMSDVSSISELYSDLEGDYKDLTGDFEVDDCCNDDDRLMADGGADDVPDPPIRINLISYVDFETSSPRKRQLCAPEDPIPLNHKGLFM